MSEITFQNEHGDNVIQLRVKTEWHGIGSKECKHRHVEIDEKLAELQCLDCKAKLNPVGFIASLVRNWAHVKRLYEQNREAAIAYQAKKRCRCEHCGKITSVRPASSAEIREFKAGIKQDEGKPL